MTPSVKASPPDAASRRRRSLCLTSFAAAALIGVTSVGVTSAHAADTPTPAPAPEGVSSFILPVLPDTQFYSRYSASQFVPQYGTNPYEVQTQWIVDNQDTLDIPFTVHVGDVVDQQGQQREWDAAEKAMQILTDGNVPYSILPGNHDLTNSGGRSSAENAVNYRARFGADAMAAQAGPALIDTFQDGISSAYLFEAEGHTWMSLALAWNASVDTIEWAQGVLDAHPGVPVVLSSHAIINIADDQLSPAPWGWGEELWETLIRSNDQIILTVNGHFHGATAQTRLNDFGNPVHQVLTDYQMSADGGNGIMTLFEFDLSNNEIDVETVSPWVPVKHPESLTSSDTPVLDGTWQSFTLELDFADRFGWTLDPAQENGADLSELAKAIVSEGWTGDGAGAALVAAGNSADYPVVDGTVAHWRFGDVTAGTVTDSAVVPDVAGDSPLRRPHIDDTAAPEEWDDMFIAHDNAAFYAADQGSVCFANVSRDPSGGPSRLSYLSTDEGAPVTNVELTAESGYTIETFVQLDADWSEAQNRWSAAITRGGARDQAGIPDNADPGAGVSWLGISSLREYQFSAADTRTSRSYTLWSGEIMPSSWHHVAIVNDPERDAATMYVDGVPVLRNASGVGGMVSMEDMPWVLGASLWDNEPDQGWHGCIGETRIVDRALDTGEFLYNRVNVDTDGPNFAISTDLGTPRAADDPLTTITGTGYPGATVRFDSVDGEAGRAEVDSFGAWEIILDAPISQPGVHDLTVVQAMGTREGSEMAVRVTIDAGDTSTPEPTASPDPTPTTSPEPEATPPQGPSDADGDRDDLATTGGALLPVALLGALGFATVTAGLLLRRRRVIS